MPLIERKLVGYALPEIVDPTVLEVTPTQGETAGAAFRQENFIYNAHKVMSRSWQEPDPNFSVLDELEKRGLGQNVEYGRRLARARNVNHFDIILGDIKQEEVDRGIISRSGWAGVAWMIAAGIISPTTFIPLIGTTARGGKAVMQGLMSGALAASLEEAMLGTAQETRTYEEMVFSIGASTALGGILGGTVGMLRNAEKARLVKGIEHEVEGSAGQLPDNASPLAIPKTVPSSIGAAASFRAPKGTAGPFGSQMRFGTKRWNLESMSPVTRTLNSPLATARTMMAQISDAGVRLLDSYEGKIVAPEGLIENRIAGWRRGLAKGLDGLDQTYADYALDKQGVSYFRDTRGMIAGITRSDKMSKAEFNAEVSRALREGEEFQGLEQAKAAAAILRKEIFDPMLKEMQRLKMLPEELNTVGDTEYLNRLYNKVAIERDTEGFVKALADHYEMKLQEDFNSRVTKLKEQEAAEQQFIEDFNLSQREVDALRTQLEEQLSALEGTPLKRVADQVNDLRQEARDAPRTSNLSVTEPRPAAGSSYEELLSEARQMEAAGGEEYKAFKKTRAALRHRLRNLNKTLVALDKKRVAKLESIDRIEEQQLNTLGRLNRAYVRFQKQLEKVSDEDLGGEVKRLRNLFHKSVGVLERSEKRMQDILDADEADMGKMFNEAVRQEGLFDKLNTYAERIDEAEDLFDNRQVLRELMDASFEEVSRKANDLNSRRALRKEKLRQQAAELDPEKIKQAVEDIQAKGKDRRLEVREQLRKKGFDDVDLDNMTMTVRETAEARARAVKDKIMGNHTRVVGMDILGEERGPELARVLDIPSRNIEPWLENNVEQLVRAYVRTVSSDIEIHRTFGSVNAKDWFDKLKAEQNSLLEKAPTAEEKDAAIKAAKGNKAAMKEAKAALTQEEINHAYQRAFDDLAAVIGRLRHTWGIPANPHGFAARAARVALNVNTLRLMGMVAVSSVADVARTSVKYGPVRAFKFGLVPLVTNFKALKMSWREAQLAGTALDVFLHTRMYEMMDLMDDYGYLTRFEKGLDFATSKIGIIAGFDYWNTAMKQFAAVMFNAEVLDSIQTLVEQGHKGARNTKKATNFLASLNIDGDSAADIWRLVSETEGGGNVNGVWLPNTEEWLKSAEQLGMPIERAEQLRRLYRAALVREVDATIVTPGVERPLIMDSTLTGKILFQFKSFAASSTQKTLMAGMQERNANFALGSAISLGFGALSYELYKRLSQDPYKEEGWEKYMDEAIDRSGLLGVLGLVRESTAAVPGLNDFTTFSGQQTTRRGGESLVGKAFGPTLDAAQIIGRIASGIDDPTQATTKQIRKLLPYQNVWWMRKFVFDNLEEGFNSIFRIPKDRR